jgi:DNA-binding transcriptional LysR family regulator
MTPLDTRALQMFVAVATCLNFRQAAEQLHMTQPPLSRAIRALELRLGVTLFTRDTQRVIPTPAALSLLPQALHILRLLEQAGQSIARHTPAPAGLRLGLTNAVEGGSFRALTAALDGTALTLTLQPSPRLVAALRNGKLDAALIGLPCKTFDLTVQPLCRQPLMVALSSGHALARRRRLALADLRHEAVFFFERARQPAFFDHCHNAFRRHGFAPRFVREPHEHHVLLSDVAAGNGVALLPASFAALRLNGVSYRPLKEGEELACGIGLVIASALHPAAAALRAAATTLDDGSTSGPCK